MYVPLEDGPEGAKHVVVNEIEIKSIQLRLTARL
jgi:hypothetical protein